MRYWGWLGAKLLAWAAVIYGLVALLNRLSPTGPVFKGVELPRFGYSLSYTLGSGACFLIACGLFFLVVHDQRRRCRVCVRRLRMPVATGSWSRMLQFGRPRTEYICPYGHGTLKEADLQIAGRENSEWKPNADMWDELCSASRESDTKS